MNAVARAIFMRPRIIAALAAALSLFAVLLVELRATAAASSGEPYQIRQATLTQDGQDLVWDVELAEPFTAAGLARGQRSLCLLIERVATGDVWGELCVIAPRRHSREARLAYLAVTAHKSGPARAVTATLSRPSTTELVASFLPAAADLRYGPLRWQTISTLRGAACATPGPGTSCFELYPARSTLLKLHTPVLVGCVASGPSKVFQGSSGAREIALTFDDGPWNDPPTVDFLHMLEREHVPATFFEIGRQIPVYDPGGAIERQMLADGDMIGDHTWTHPVMTSLSASQQRAQLLQTADAIKQATRGFTPCLWRPPYGATSSSLISLARSLGMLTIMWDVDPRDWALPGVGAIYSNVIANAHNGAIVEMHFGGGPRYETLAALPRIIDALRARGYTFVNLAQMLGLQLIYR